MLLRTGKPGRPAELLPADITATGLKLLVRPPEDDGGTPVTGYAVDLQLVPSHRWARHGIVPLDSTPAYVGRLRRYHAVAVEDLAAQVRYRVRVSAVNGAGSVGPPCLQCCHKPSVNEGRPTSTYRSLP